MTKTPKFTDLGFKTRRDGVKGTRTAKTPAITLAKISKYKPCSDRFANAEKLLPKRRRITVAMAREAGVPLDDITWVLSALARSDKDVERRMRLWLADCAAHVLHIYQKTETSDAPRRAITATRQYARGEIGTAAWAAARRAAWAATRAATRDAAQDAACAATRAAALRAAVLDAAWAVTRAAAWAATHDAELDAAYGAARDAAWYAVWDAENDWQLDRLTAWFSADEPADWPTTDKVDGGRNEH